MPPSSSIASVTVASAPPCALALEDSDRSANGAPSAVPTTSAGELADWFNDEVHAHENQLKAFLRGSFPSVRDVDDVVQESYLRVWRARTAQPIQSAKAFLFRVARNLALDTVRHHRRSPVDGAGDAAALDVIDETPTVAEAINLNERIALLTAALDALTTRHRQAVILCKLQGVSHRDAALRLGISEKTVTEHVYRGVQRLGEELQRRGVHHFPS